MRAEPIAFSKAIQQSRDIALGPVVHAKSSCDYNESSDGMHTRVARAQRRLGGHRIEIVLAGKQRDPVRKQDIEPARYAAVCLGIATAPLARGIGRSRLKRSTAQCYLPTTEEY
jgi:hypothetical protein